ncbi:MAG: hypothetical protein SNJ84_07080 [Verrucomicrobiia bacterium]
MKLLGLLVIGSLALMLPVAPLLLAMEAADCCCTASANACSDHGATQSGLCSHGTCTCPTGFPSSLLAATLPISQPAYQPVAYLAFRPVITDAPVFAPEPPPPRV